MSLKLYYNLMSQPSRALYIFLKKCNIPFEQHEVDMRKGEHLSPEYAQINPLQKVPAIVHNGNNMIESVAILRYLCREYKIDDHWYPSSSLGQARVDEYLEWQHLNTRAHLAMYFRELVLVPFMTGKEPNPEKVKVLKQRMEDSLDLLENHWLKDNAFLAGNKISIADIIAACEVQQPKLTGYDTCQGRPRISAWMKKVEDETNPYFTEAHKFVIKRFQKLKSSL